MDNPDDHPDHPDNCQCYNCQLEQADADVVQAMNRYEELKKRKTEEKNIADIETMKKMYRTHEPLCPECGRRAFPTNFPAHCFGGKKYDKRTVWFCSDMGHCAFSVGENTKWQLKKEKQNELSDSKTV